MIVIQGHGIVWCFKMIIDNIKEYTTRIVAAYVSRNYLKPNQIKMLIELVYSALSEIDAPSNSVDSYLNRRSEVQIKESLKHEWLISFIDGQPYKSLKRHLSSHGLTPDAYRTRYGLPADYPMVAPAYAARRSQIAKDIRFGHKDG